MSRLERAGATLFRSAGWLPSTHGMMLVRRAVKVELRCVKHPDGIGRAQSLQIPGCCIFCEERLPQGRRVICAERECKKAYNRAYKRDRSL